MLQLCSQIHLSDKTYQFYSVLTISCECLLQKTSILLNLYSFLCFIDFNFFLFWDSRKTCPYGNFNSWFCSIFLFYCLIFVFWLDIGNKAKRTLNFEIFLKLSHSQGPKLYVVRQLIHSPSGEIQLFVRHCRLRCIMEL